MLKITLLPVLASLQLAAAHFSVEYPTWRGDSFATGASQWLWPCANVSQTPASEVNRTAWPLTGGSINIHSHHPWALTYVNLGFGNVWTGSVNSSLVANFNQTGNGTFCIKELGRKALEGLRVEEGVNATLQVVQIATTGAALYNCADITFSSTAQLLDDADCANSTGVGGVAIANLGTTATEGQDASASGTGTGASPTSSKGAAARGVVVSPGLGLVAVGMGIVGVWL